jgi:hypothetical protein
LRRPGSAWETLDDPGDQPLGGQLLEILLAVLREVAGAGRVPMRFQQRGGRKRIVSPDGSAIVPTTKPQPDGALVKALARAWRWQRMLDDGVYATVSDIGDAENISKSYVSRILRLALLAPDIVDGILAGSTDQTLVLERLERPLPASWEQQRQVLLAFRPGHLDPQQ